MYITKVEENCDRLKREREREREVIWKAAPWKYGKI